MSPIISHVELTSNNSKFTFTIAEKIEQNSSSMWLYKSFYFDIPNLQFLVLYGLDSHLDPVSTPIQHPAPVLLKVYL